MNMIFKKFVTRYCNSVSKHLSLNYFQQNAFLSPVCITRYNKCYSTKQDGPTTPVENQNESTTKQDDTMKPVEYQIDKTTNKKVTFQKFEDPIDLPTKRKEKNASVIEPTEYYHPDMSSIENFEEKFWAAYQDKMKREAAEAAKDYPDSIRYRKVYNNPIERAFGIIKDDVLEYLGRLKRNPVVYIRNPMLETRSLKEEQVFPHYCDIVIIGGGIVGTSIAFHLQERARDGLRIVVVERDLSYSKASTVLSVGGIRQQFSTPENIILSKYGMDFLQQMDMRLGVKGQPPPTCDLTFGGYLTLASEEGYQQLKANYELQRSHGSFVKMFTKDQLKLQYPWLNTDGVDAGVLGVQREGWFDPWSLLLAINRKSKELGTEYVNGTVVDCNLGIISDVIRNQENRIEEMQQVKSIKVKLPSGESRDINCAVCVIAAGAWSKEVGRMFGVGTAPSGTNSFPIPVEPRKRFVYCVKSPNGPGLNCPLVIDPSGAYFRREGLADLYLCGRAPQPEDEPSIDDFSVDYDFFENNVWPLIAQRCPSFENLKVNSAWAGFYDYNTFDQNAIIGRHPMFMNLFISTGFSGHGIQQAAGAGCAISELIIDAGLKTLDIESFGFERILVCNPILEKCCY